MSPIDGAQEAFDEIEQFKAKEGLKNNGLAARFGMTPSTVNRVLESRDRASWTPGFKKIYCNVKNAQQGKSAEAKATFAQITSGPRAPLARMWEAYVQTKARG